MRYLVTGGAGFIGSNFIRFLFRKYGDAAQVVNLDKLTYAGNLENLSDLENDPKHLFVKGDKYLDSDAVFGVKESLIVNFRKNKAGVAQCRYGFVLKRKK